MGEGGDRRRDGRELHCEIGKGPVSRLHGAMRLQSVDPYQIKKVSWLLAGAAQILVLV